MPCRSDYLEPTQNEVALSQVACLLDELDGKPIDKHHWRGFHPAVYNAGRSLDGLVADLCSRLQSEDVSKRSLEMQIWWRDHQKADKARIAHELNRQRTAKERAAALAKLTDYERRLLGLE